VGSVVVEGGITEGEEEVEGGEAVIGADEVTEEEEADGDSSEDLTAPSDTHKTATVFAIYRPMP